MENPKCVNPVGARERAAPEAIAPMLASLLQDAPDGDDWLHEIKFDGYRAIVHLVSGTARIFTRNGHDWTARFRTIATAAAQLPAGEAWIDGEAVVLGAGGASNFQALQQALAEGQSARIGYFAFDLLYLDGWDLRAAPLVERKALLADLLKEAVAPLRFSDHVIGGGPQFKKQACVFALEGCISKKASSTYRSGRQSAWVKAKCVNRQEFVVGGFTRPAGRKNGIGAMVLGIYEDGKLIHSGRVGTGFTEAEQVALDAHFTALRRADSPFAGKVPGQSGMIWVQPSTVVEVEFAQWTEDGLIRHGSYQGIRQDKDARKVAKEVAPANVEAPTRKRGSGQRARKAEAMPQLHRLEPDIVDQTLEALALTHPDKVLFPQQGLTKRDLAAYYLEIADWILPHVAGRPLVLVRCPQGSGRKCFYQRHRHDGLPDTVKGIECGDEAPCVYIDSAEGLVGLVQVGVLEIHTWGAPVAGLDHPDRIVFDLDPDEAMPWAQIADGARRVRAELETLGLRSFLKTTGGKGLHLTVPVLPNQDWDTIKTFCKAIAQRLEESDPTRYVVNMAKAKRKGRIFIDYLRNQRSASFVAPFSPRAREGAPVAVPLFWDELDAGIRPAHFSVTTVARRLAALSEDPWADMAACRQDLSRAVAEVLGKRS
jgi:bifunctional non-homologous end joining protein LigD